MLLIAVLAMLIVVNVVLLFLLIRPDRILTARSVGSGPRRWWFAYGDICASYPVFGISVGTNVFCQS